MCEVHKHRKIYESICTEVPSPLFLHLAMMLWYLKWSMRNEIVGLRTLLRGLLDALLAHTSDHKYLRFTELDIRRRDLCLFNHCRVPPAVFLDTVSIN